MYIYLLSSLAIAGYYVYYEDILNRIFQKDDEYNENYQSVVFMDFDSKKENTNPYFYKINSIQYKYQEFVKDVKLKNDDVEVKIEDKDFYDQLFNIFYEHIMVRQMKFNNPVYVFVKSENDKDFLEYHLKQLQMYDDYLYIMSFETVFKFLKEHKSYKFSDLIYHYSINTKNKKQVELMELLYQENNKLLQKRVKINDIENQYYKSISLDINNDLTCTKKEYSYKMNYGEEESDRESEDSTDYDKMDCIQEFIIKQFNTNPIYLYNYITYTTQLELNMT